MERTPEDLNYISDQQQVQEPQVCTERPLSHRILAVILIAVILFGFVGMCYWLAFYGV